MKNNAKYFCNNECEYYPCHKGMDESKFNCLFCYCPLVHMKNCPGEPKEINVHGNVIRDCSECNYPHIPENYDKIIKLLIDNPS